VIICVEIARTYENFSVCYNTIGPPLLEFWLEFSDQTELPSGEPVYIILSERLSIASCHICLSVAQATARLDFSIKGLRLPVLYYFSLSRLNLTFCCRFKNSFTLCCQ